MSKLVHKNKRNSPWHSRRNKAFDPGNDSMLNFMGVCEKCFFECTQPNHQSIFDLFRFWHNYSVFKKY